MKKGTLSIIIFTVLYSTLLFAQLDSVYYQGPSQGNVSSGVMVNTNNFLSTSVATNNFKNIPNPNLLDEQVTESLNFSESELPTYHYSTDKSVLNKINTSTGQTILLNGWETDRLANFIPPDPDVAVGPNHIITTVNVDFSIWDKEGNLINNINGETWCGQAMANPGAFDPQIIYDHYAGRWFMLWDARSVSTESSFVISYSDDDDPNGIWYSYAINASMNGSNNTNYWADFPHVGFDEEAIYITSNQFPIGGGNQFFKIRIISKSELYSSNGGPLTWRDIWNIKRPGGSSSGQNMMTTQPAISYTSGDNGYFAWAAWFTENYYAIFKINNPTTSPSLRGKTIGTQQYLAPPLANQLGGGTLLENSGAFKNKVIVRDGYLYAVHAIGNSTASGYSSIKYIKIDISSNTIIEQSEFGASGYFYMYPVITVDKDNNIAVTYSRSADTEYVGGYYSTKYDGDPPGLNGSWPLVEGQGNYDVTFGGTRNRWGDYLGIYLDPSNDYDVWIFPEYAAAQNIWGTYIGQIRMVPYPGVHLFANSSTIDFRDVEINSPPATQSVTISNYGEDDLIINGISSPVGPFTLLNSLSYPDTLYTYDSLDLVIEFDPSTPAVYNEFMAFDVNDPNFDGLILNGTGFEINPAFTGVLYSSTGPAENGIVLSVNMNNGVGTELGPSNFAELNSLTIDPVTNVLYGIFSGGSETELVRVNALGGDGFTQYTLEIGTMAGIAFDASGILYGATRAGVIYTIDLSDGSLSLVTTASIQLSAIAFNPLTNQMWAVPRVIIGVKDKIYTIDLTTGEATLVGQTEFGLLTNDLAFDENEILYGVIGGANEGGQLITINTTDGSGSLVGDIGFQNVVGLAYTITGEVNSVNPDKDKNFLPQEFALSQNYPNPFNPSTSIEFSVPVDAKVTLTIYNLLGQIVTTLVNEEISVGNYSTVWNGTDDNGFQVSSGIYFYEMKANGNNGKAYSQMKKMVFLK